MSSCAEVLRRLQNRGIFVAIGFDGSFVFDPMPDDTLLEDVVHVGEDLRAYLKEHEVALPFRTRGPNLKRALENWVHGAPDAGRSSNNREQPA